MDLKRGNRVSAALTVVCILLISAGAVLMNALISANTNAEYRRYYSQLRAGQIADETVYVHSDVDVVDEEATEAARQKASDAVFPVFSYSEINSMFMISRFDTLRSAYLAGDRAKVEEMIGSGLATGLFNLSDKALISAVYEILLHICNRGYYVSQDIQRVRSEGFDRFTLANRYDGEKPGETVIETSSFIITDLNVTAFIVDVLESYTEDISLSDIYIVRDVLMEFLISNVFYDDVLYAERKSQAYNSVQPVAISLNRGDVLLERDRVVTEEQLRILRLLSSQYSYFLEDMILDFLFVALLVSIILVVFVSNVKADRSRIRVYLILLTFFSLAVSSGIYFSIRLAINVFNAVFIDSFLPVIFLPVIMTLITGQRLPGVMGALITSIFVAIIPDMSIMTFFYAFACGVFCVFSVRFLSRRLDAFILWLVTIVVVSVLDIFFLLKDFGYSGIELSILSTFVNVTVSILLVNILLPILERVFNLPTNFRLNELAYVDSSLLSRLSQAAPGTYSHSQNVAELARAAATAIGANPMIAYIGGLYHDIGKTEHPEYFIENQAEENKHDDINPHLSASIIRNHVKAGAQRGREAGLPSEIVDIIENHHGNDVIAYFYNEARKIETPTGHESAVNLSDYRYQAEIPSSRECAIVMLVDSIEAAARTVQAPTPAKFAKLIHQIVLNKIEKGLLNNSSLTMKDIETIEESALKTLSAQYHNRIEYPDEDKDKEKN